MDTPPKDLIVHDIYVTRKQGRDNWKGLIVLCVIHYYEKDSSGACNTSKESFRSFLDALASLKTMIKINKSERFMFSRFCGLLSDIALDYCLNRSTKHYHLGL